MRTRLIPVVVLLGATLGLSACQNPAQPPPAASGPSRVDIGLPIRPQALPAPSASASAPASTHSAAPVTVHVAPRPTPVTRPVPVKVPTARPAPVKVPPVKLVPVTPQGPNESEGRQQDCLNRDGTATGVIGVVHGGKLTGCPIIPVSDYEPETCADPHATWPWTDNTGMAHDPVCYLDPSGHKVPRPGPAMN